MNENDKHHISSLANIVSARYGVDGYLSSIYKILYYLTLASFIYEKKERKVY